MQQYYNRHTHVIAYKEGQYVWLKTKHNKTGECRKLAPRRNGPWTIVEKLPNGVNFKIRNKSNETKVVHHDRLLPVISHEYESSSEKPDNVSITREPETSLPSDSNSLSESDFETNEENSIVSESDEDHSCKELPTEE